MLKYEALKEKTDEELREIEYLLTNGIGGYGSSTITGRQTRKYHGILVASLNPPVERYMGLAKLCDTVSIGNTDYNLNHYDITEKVSCESVCPIRFEKKWGAEQHYLLDGLKIKKTHMLIRGVNRAVVSYEIDNSLNGKDTQLRIRPEFSLRDHHEVNTAKDEMPNWALEQGILNLKQKIESQVHSPGQVGTRQKTLNVSLQVMAGKGYDLKNYLSLEPIAERGKWYGPYFLDNEAERGLENYHFNFSPLEYCFEVKSGSNLVFHIITEIANRSIKAITPEELEADLKALEAYYIDRTKYVETIDSPDEALVELAKIATLAADDFIVHRKSTGHLSILAGYPWFTDWGRDSMISLPGLTLSAGETERFKDIFETFVSYMKSGILPNMFPDDGKEPIYNTVDATLWMPIAMYRYIEKMGKDSYANQHFLPVLREIIRNYEAGTLNNTYMDQDGLIWSGDESTQLTWMDVKVNGWVVTPRHGKAVEINALWYNCLMIAASLASDSKEEAIYTSKANLVKEAFRKEFWNSESNALYDVVRGEEKLKEIRPNQLFAVSLPYPLLDKNEGQQVFETVKKHLWIGVGLRSLSPEDENYQGIYEGDVLKRDGAYHRGTGWGWLLGPYLDALWALSAQTKDDLNEIREILIYAGETFHTLCMGQYPENFDGNSPHHGRGCMAQAWSVAEYLRWSMNLLKLENRVK